MENKKIWAEGNNEQLVIYVAKKTLFFSIICLLLVAVLVVVLVLASRPKYFEIHNLDFGHQTVLKSGEYADIYRYELCVDLGDTPVRADFDVYANGKEVSPDDVVVSVVYQQIAPLDSDGKYPYITYYSAGWTVTITVKPVQGGKYEGYPPLVHIAEVFYHF